MEAEKIAIITDSACDLPRSYIDAQENLYVLPLVLTYEEGTYQSGIDITAEEVFARMERNEVPKTSLPTPEDVNQLFDTLEKKSIHKAVFVLMSSGLSGTYGMVELIARQRPKFESIVYDSKILSMSLGYMVMNAVDLVKKGLAFDKLRAGLEALRQNIDGMFYLPSLEYLIRGGRIGLVAGMVGKLLKIQPIIGCNAEGKYYARATSIGARRTMDTVKRIVSDFVGARRYELSVVHADASEEASRLLNELKKLPGMVSSQILPLSPVLSVHVGKGMIAVCTRVLPEMG